MKNCVGVPPLGLPLRPFLYFWSLPYPRGRSDSRDQAAFAETWVGSLQPSCAPGPALCVHSAVRLGRHCSWWFSSDPNTNTTNWDCQPFRTRQATLVLSSRPVPVAAVGELLPALDGQGFPGLPQSPPLPTVSCCLPCCRGHCLPRPSRSFTVTSHVRSPCHSNSCCHRRRPYAKHGTRAPSLNRCRKPGSPSPSDLPVIKQQAPVPRGQADGQTRV